MRPALFLAALLSVPVPVHAVAIVPVQDDRSIAALGQSATPSPPFSLFSAFVGGVGAPNASQGSSVGTTGMSGGGQTGRDGGGDGPGSTVFDLTFQVDEPAVYSLAGYAYFHSFPCARSPAGAERCALRADADSPLHQRSGGHRNARPGRRLSLGDRGLHDRHQGSRGSPLEFHLRRRARSRAVHRSLGRARSVRSRRGPTKVDDSLTAGGWRRTSCTPRPTWPDRAARRGSAASSSTPPRAWPGSTRSASCPRAPCSC